MEKTKLIVVGDSAVGKTCLLLSYVNNEFPSEYIPTIFDNYTKTVTYREQTVNLDLWDSSGGDYYDRFRQMSYAQTDVVLVCFSLISRASFENVKIKWVPEVRHYLPDTPFLLIGNKADLWHDPEILQKLAKQNVAPITADEMRAMALELGAVGYYENSALKREGLTEVFDNAIRAALYPNEPGNVRAPTPTLPNKPDVPAVHANTLPLSRFASLVGKKEFSDCTFVLPDKSEVPAHKVILGSGMPIFCKALLQKCGNMPPIFTVKNVGTNHATARTFTVQELAVTDQIIGRSWQYGPETPFTTDIGHGLTAFTVSGVVYLVGGADYHGRFVKHMLRFDLTVLGGNKWLDPLEFEGTAGVDYPSGNLHSTCVNHDTQEAILFGGKSNGYSNTTWLFNTETVKWKKVETKGTAPTPRYGHSAVIHEGKMIVFGGYDNEDGKCYDMYELSLDSHEWTQLKPSGDRWPQAKYNHHATVLTVGGAAVMILFGGSNGTQVLDEVNVFDLHERSWVPVKIKGPSPAPRSGFSASNVDAHQWLIFSGQDSKTQSDFDDCWILCENQGSLTWKNISIKGEVKPRCYHASVYDPALGRVYLFGGKLIDNTATADLTVLSVRGDRTGEWLREEPTVIEVDIDPAVFRCILDAIYTGSLEINRDFSPHIVQETAAFFLKFPRFNSEERRKILVDLALTPNPPLTDVCFDLDGKTRGYAHKALLAAANDYFSAIFSSGMKEAQLDAIPLTDVDQSALAVLKEFLYSGYTDSLTAGNVVNLIYLANKYNAKELLSQCEVVCKENIESFDVWELHQLATQHNCPQLAAYLVWEMRVRYEEIKDKAWFKKELDAEVRREVVAGQWPGEKYKHAMETWKKNHKDLGEKN